jgi:hypothetical protein
MSGTAVLNSMLLGSATAATSVSSVTVGGIPTGSFAGTAGSSVTWVGFSWPSIIPVTPLWTFTSGGSTYSFDLNSVTVDSQDNNFLNLNGVGTLKKIGVGAADPTTGQWSFTISNPGGGGHANFAFTFANSQTSVPEGGSALALLGLGLIGLGALRKSLARKA